LSMFAVLSLCLQLPNAILSPQVLNPFNANFEGFELASVYGLIARIRALQYDSETSGRYVDLQELRLGAEACVVDGNKGTCHMLSSEECEIEVQAFIPSLEQQTLLWVDREAPVFVR